MPVHDWTRVSAGTFHSFHTAWITHLYEALNDGVLPSVYYAMAEQVAGDVSPDVLALHAQSNGNGSGSPALGDTGTVLVAPPKVSRTAETEIDQYLQKQNHITIRHTSNDRVVALLEIVSAGNKSGQQHFRKYLDKSLAALAHGHHLLIVDLHPPTARDPQGIHGAIWAELCNDSYTAPPDKPMTLVAYAAGKTTRAYIEPVAVGDALPDMPLYLDPQGYVLVPLEATYQAAYKGTPARWKSVLEAKEAS